MKKRNYTDQQFKDAVATNTSMSGVLRDLGVKSMNFQPFRDLALRLGADMSHWTGQSHRLGQQYPQTSGKPLEEILVVGQPLGNRGAIKRRLIRAGTWRDECHKCGISTWLDQPLSLQMDHVNGDGCDNRLANLRLLCPNCHSQTPTFAGRNKKQEPKKIRLCPCGALICRSAKRCAKCASAERRKQKSGAVSGT